MFGLVDSVLTDKAGAGSFNGKWELNGNEFGNGGGYVIKFGSSGQSIVLMVDIESVSLVGCLGIW